jgi:hypothetical protein
LSTTILPCGRACHSIIARRWRLSRLLRSQSSPRSLRHHCQACLKISKLFIAYLEGFPTPTRRWHCRSSCNRVRQGGFSRCVREAQHIQERGAHGLREARAQEMGEAPNGISPAARRGDEQEAAPSEQSAVAAAAQVANQAKRLSNLKWMIKCFQNRFRDRKSMISVHDICCDIHDSNHE